jgi:hypothetical protein
MSWHFSQALVEEYSEENFSDGEPSALLNGTDTHGMFWSPDKTMEASTPSRSGMTFKPSTDTHGEALLMSCREDSRARISVPPEKEPASKASDPVCGHTWRELSAKFDPASSSWKTHRCLWEEDLQWSSVTLPKWGMMRDGVCWEQTTPELPTSGNESGSWATPNANMQAEITEERALELGWIWKGTSWYTADGVKKNSSLTHQVKMFPTPYGLSANQGQDDGEFGKAIRNWPTPTRNDAVGAGYQKANGNHYFTLPGAVGATNHLPLEMEEKRVQMWPTPNASDHKGAGKDGKLRDRLDYAVERGQTKSKQYPTPTASSGGPEPEGKTGRKLTTVVGGQLNPNWVEWLMGWPVGWTDCGALETDRFRMWPHSPGKFSPPTFHDR